MRTTQVKITSAQEGKF